MSSTAIAIYAASSSSSAAVAANEARRIACAGLVRGYQHDTATVAQIHEYASCVAMLYPTAASNTAMKWFVAGLFVSFLIGAIVGYIKEPWNFGAFDAFEFVMFGVIGLCAYLVGVIALLGLFFIFS